MPPSALKQRRVKNHRQSFRQPGDLDRLRYLGPPLFLEPLTAEDDRACPRRTTQGTFAQLHHYEFGGQTPLKLAVAALEVAEIPSRHLTRRHRSRRGPRTVPAASAPVNCANPPTVPVRPRPPRSRGASAIGGDHRPMCWVAAPWRSCEPEQLRRYMRKAVQASWARIPVLIDLYLEDAIEVDADVSSRRRRRCSQSPGSLERISRKPAFTPRFRLLAAAPYRLRSPSSPNSGVRPRRWPWV